MTARISSALTVIGLSVVLSTPAAATTLTFDDLAPVDANYPSNQYGSLGVIIQSLVWNPAVDAVGETFTPILFADGFGVLSNANSVSAPNFAVTQNVFIQPSGAFFSFSKPMHTLSLQTDDATEASDTVRLMALRSIGGGLFEVIAVAAGSDAATTAPANTLSLFLPDGFSFAVFATYTEPEGFDNLTFVPEPTTMALLGSGLAAAIVRRRHARRRQAAVAGS